MNYRIRFNKSRGMPGRGSADHVWRVFEGDTEYLFKHFELQVPARSEREAGSDEWNLVCQGVLRIDRVTSTAIIEAEPPASSLAPLSVGAG